MDEPRGTMVNDIPMPPRASGLIRKPYDWIHPSKVRHSRTSRIWTSINRNPGWVLAALILLYLVIACGQSATKLLWGDELITLSIAQQGSFAGIWHALALGTDPNPPLMHWLVMVSTKLFGQSAFAVRLPAIFCVLLAIVSLWAILRRWLSPGYAAVGVLAFMATRGFDYAYDARSYAPLMGFAMASLAFWLASTTLVGRPRLWALAGMAAALTLGLSSNYYGVLAFFPIAAGEAVRAARRPLHVEGASGIQPGAWIAMAVAALPLLAFLPLIHHNIAEFTPHAWNRPHAGMVLESYIELVEGIFWPVLGFALFIVWKVFTESSFPAASRKKPPVQMHEAIALIVLILYPILGFCIAAGGAGMVSPRCVVPVCCGFGIVVALCARRIFGGRARAGVILLSIALFWVVTRECVCAVLLARQSNAFLVLRDQVDSESGERPIVVTDSLFVLPLAHYSPDKVRARIVFPIDFDAIHRTENDDSGEQNLWAGRDGVFPIRIVPYDRSIFAFPALTVVSRYGGWAPEQLIRDGFTLSGEELTWSQTYTWQQLGGVFTPLAHEETRILNATIPDKQETNDSDKYIMINP
jgi:Dolichyl-phosphate-mannose-protein mannosyltransferase